MKAPLTFTRLPKVAGSPSTIINADLNGRPFAQLWTFTVPGETHPWHAKPAADPSAHQAFYPHEGGLDAAKSYLTRWAGL